MLVKYHQRILVPNYVNGLYDPGPGAAKFEDEIDFLEDLLNDRHLLFSNFELK